MHPPTHIPALLRKQYQVSLSAAALGGLFLLVSGWTLLPLSNQRLDPDPVKNILALGGMLVVFFSLVVRPIIDIASARTLLVAVEPSDSAWSGTTIGNQQRVLPRKVTEREEKSFYSRRYLCEVYQSEGGGRYYFPVSSLPR